jgi:ATP-binding cassette subfamily F protein 3
VSHLGGWADYVRDREARKEAEAARSAKADGAGSKPAGSKPAGAKPAGSNGARAADAKPAISKNRAKQIAKLERQVAEAEAALAALEDELADPGAWASPTGAERSAKRHADAKGKIDSLYEELLALSEE